MNSRNGRSAHPVLGSRIGIPRPLKLVSSALRSATSLSLLLLLASSPLTSSLMSSMSPLAASYELSPRSMAERSSAPRLLESEITPRLESRLCPISSDDTTLSRSPANAPLMTRFTDNWSQNSWFRHALLVNTSLVTCLQAFLPSLGPESCRRVLLSSE